MYIRGMNAQTRTFKSGNSVAVRLPKDLGMEAGVEVRLERVGNSIRITPEPQEPTLERTRAMLEKLRTMPRPTEREVREPFEYPDRPGLID